jgi:hypothetical protein
MFPTWMHAGRPLRKKDAIQTALEMHRGENGTFTFAIPMVTNSHSLRQSLSQSKVRSADLALEFFSGINRQRESP